MKSTTVIDICRSGLSKMDDRFLNDYRELRCNDITSNGCHLKVYRNHGIWLKGKFYPNEVVGSYYLGNDTIPRNQDPKKFIDSLNEMMNDFFERNGIEEDTFLLYVHW